MNEQLSIEVLEKQVPATLRPILDRVRGLSGVSRVGTVARLLNLPKIDDIPRPGQAKNWRFDEWMEWAKPYGMEKGDDSTHSMLITHPYLRRIIITPAKTPGDFRSGMALATEVKRNFRAEYVKLSVLMEHLLLHFSQLFVAETEVENERMLGNQTVQLRHTQRGTDLLAAARTEEWERRKQCQNYGINTAKTERIRKLLRTASGLYNESQRAVIQKIVVSSKLGADIIDKTGNLEDAGDDFEKIAERMYNMINVGDGLIPPIDDVMIDELTMIIDVEETLQEDRKVQKKAEREAAEKKAKDDADKIRLAADQATSGGSAAYGTAIAAVREELKQHANKIRDAVNAMAHFSASFHSPPYPADKLLNQNDTIAKMSAELQQATVTLFERKGLLLILEEENARLKAEQQAAQLLLEEAGQDNWRTVHADFVNAVAVALAPGDFLALADGIREVKRMIAETREKLKT